MVEPNAMKSRMQPRRYRRLLALVGVMRLLLPESVQAQTTLHATGLVGISYTDNLLGAPSQPQLGSAPPVSTFYLTLTPGLELYNDNERSRYFLAYSHPFNIYLDHNNLSTSGDVVLGRGIWLLSPQDELLLGISASRMTTAASLGTPQPGAPAIGDGRSRLLTLGADEHLTHAFSERWQGKQFANAARTETLSGPISLPTFYSTTAGLGVDYALDRNAWGLQTSTTYFWLGQVPEGTVVLGQRRQLIVDSFARFRRDLNETWSCEARLGIVNVSDLGSGIFTAPRWGATLLWNREALSASLGYDRTVTVSMITGYTYLSDTVQANFHMPLVPIAHLSAVAGMGLSHNQILTFNQDLGTLRTYVWASQASVGYFPDTELPQVFLTYSHFEQHNQGGYSVIAPTFTRNTISLFVSGRFPSRAFSDIPSASPQRVDGADRSPNVTQGIRPSPPSETSGSNGTPPNP
jgi:hypothetical protein